MAEIIVLILIISAGLWALVCIHRAGKQRELLIDSWGIGHPLFWMRADEFHRVSYESHLWELMTFRDPRKLYGPLTQEIWNGPAGEGYTSDSGRADTRLPERAPGDS